MKSQSDHRAKAESIFPQHAVPSRFNTFFIPKPPDVFLKVSDV